MHAETDELNPVQLFTRVKHLRNVSPNQKVDWDHVKIAMTAILILLFILRSEFYALLEMTFTCVFPATFTYGKKPLDRNQPEVYLVFPLYRVYKKEETKLMSEFECI
jgi:hypothetical protein